MKIAIMQPYLFPYMGYFELLASVDKFVFLEDVQYTPRTWINRNRVASNQREFQYLTIPILSHARNEKICNIRVLNGWSKKLKFLIESQYGRNFLDHPICKAFWECEGIEELSNILKTTIVSCCKHFGLLCEFHSSINLTEKISQARIVDLCKIFGATEYFNLSGGRELYDQKKFGSIKLRILNPCAYPNKFSILDVVARDEKGLLEHLKTKNWLKF